MFLNNATQETKIEETQILIVLNLFYQNQSHPQESLEYLRKMYIKMQTNFFKQMPEPLLPRKNSWDKF